MDFSNLYSEKVLAHVKNPQNLGEMKDPDGVVTVGNKTCGDIMRLFIKVGKKDGKEIIEDVKFQTLGCGAALATSSMVTTMVKGKTLEEAEQVTNKAVAEALDGLPSSKMHCSNLAAEALLKAIEDYKNKNPKH
jgi:nitrogen fixation protein NifU and related proteins